VTVDHFGWDDDFELEFELVIRESVKAILLRTEDGEVWVPKSQILGGIPEVGEVDDTVHVTGWYAREKDWI
jgi:hypothetical protein